jgi:hypothetical protein
MVVVSLSINWEAIYNEIHNLFGSQLRLLRGASQHCHMVYNHLLLTTVRSRSVPINRDRQSRASAPRRLSKSQRRKLTPRDTGLGHTSSKSQLAGLLTRTTDSERSHLGPYTSLLANTNKPLLSAVLFRVAFTRRSIVRRNHTFSRLHDNGSSQNPEQSAAVLT